MSKVKSAYDQDSLVGSELHSMINYKPYWFIRNAYIVFGIILVSVLTIISFIQFPEKVKGVISFSSFSSNVYGQMHVSKDIIYKIHEGQNVVINNQDFNPGNNDEWVGTVKYVSKIQSVQDSFDVNISLSPYSHSKINGRNFINNTHYFEAEIIISRNKLVKYLINKK